MYEPRSRQNTSRPPKNADAYTVIFTPESEAQLTELYRYIATATSPEVAARYTDSIVTYCESLQSLPHRGIERDDIRPGLRITSYRKRVVIAFEVDADQVAILGVFYGGQDYETSFQEEKDEDG
jgi:toxin ParE1/3/4